MKRAEVLRQLHIMKWWLNDHHFMILAGDVEQIEILLGPLGMTPEDARKFCEHIIPSGRRGHALLALVNPVEARARAYLVALLRSLDDPEVS